MNGVIIEKGPSNWQILQQKDGFAEITLSGRAASEGEDCQISIHVYDENDRTDVISPVYVSLDARGRWNAKLKVPAGGMYSIATYLRKGERDALRGDGIFHLGIGDVYVIAGQSNAFGTSKDNIEDRISENVHLFRLNGTWDIATHPLHDSTGAIFPELYNESAFHSPWLAFARLISEKTGISRRIDSDGKRRNAAVLVGFGRRRQTYADNAAHGGTFRQRRTRNFVVPGMQ